MTQAFISYARKHTHDSDFAEKLRTWLMTHDFTAWMERYDLQAGSHRDDSIHEALRGCDVVLGIVSPASVQDNDTLDEWAYALDKGKLQLLILHTAQIPHRFVRISTINLSTDASSEWERLQKLLANPPRPTPVPSEAKPSQAPIAPPPTAAPIGNVLNDLANRVRENIQLSNTTSAQTPPPPPVHQAARPNPNLYQPQPRPASSGLTEQQKMWLVVGLALMGLCILLSICSSLGNSGTW